MTQGVRNLCPRPARSASLGNRAFALITSVVIGLGTAPTAPTAPADSERDTGAQPEARLIELRAGDSVSLQVYGQPDMAATQNISDDGYIRVALLEAPVHVAGLSPAEAARSVEKALRDEQILIDPHVTISVLEAHRGHVSVLGEVKKPDRYPIDASTTIFDLLAQAGGTTENSSGIAYLIRRQGDGAETRIPIDLKQLSSQRTPPEKLRSGDSLYVPPAGQFSIYGEVKTPNSYRLEPHMTVMEALARAGGVTDRGSTNRIRIVRRVDNAGTFVTLHAELTDPVMPDDVIRVGESIF